VRDWRSYRLLVEGPAGARANMDRDEAILAAYRDGRVPPTWRIYDWTAPAATYGHFAAPPALPPGVEAARRLSGGGVVPHGADITYCVVCERRVGGENYEDIVAAVALALARLGVPAAVWRGGSRGQAGLCFASLAPYDVHVAGRKVAGCAQRRLRDAILHHGSIADDRPAPALVGAGLWDDAATTTIASALGRPVGVQGFARALAEVTGMQPLFGPPADDVGSTARQERQAKTR